MDSFFITIIVLKDNLLTSLVKADHLCVSLLVEMYACVYHRGVDTVIMC